MKKFLPKYLIVSLCLFVGSWLISYAQTQDEKQDGASDEDKIIHFKSNLLEQIISKEIELKKLIGDVQMWQGDVQMVCDSAYFNMERNNVDAYGNVIIEQGDSIRITADYLTYYGNERIAFLYNNVTLTDQKSEITSDTLFYEVDRKHATLFQNVHLVDQKVSVDADSLEYYITPKQAYFYNNILLTDGSMELTTDSMDYNVNTKVGAYRGGGKVVNKSTNLKSLVGIYYGETDDLEFIEEVFFKDEDYELETELLRYNLQTEMAEFEGDSKIVQEGGVTFAKKGRYDKKNDQIYFGDRTIIENEEQYLEADEFEYDKSIGIGKASGNVVWKDTIRNLTIKSQYAEYYDQDEHILATDQALLINVIDGDTLYLAADTLTTYELGKIDSIGKTDSLGKADSTMIDSTNTAADTLKTFYAYRNVKLLKTDMQAKCDSMSYSFKDSTFKLYYNPIVWLENSQLTADTIIINTENNEPEDFQLRSNAFVISENDTGVYNQIKAKFIQGFFEENDLKLIHADQNVESIYFAQNDQREYYGANKASSAELNIYIEEQKVEKVVFIKQPEGSFTPMSLVNFKDFYLKGFSWRSEEKPQNTADLFKRDAVIIMDEEDKEEIKNELEEASKKANDQGPKKPVKSDNKKEKKGKLKSKKK